jgi:hypothetical protein
MLEVWSLTGDPRIRDAAIRVLRLVLSRKREKGWFQGWAFHQGRPPFTHTIAYTLCGLQESARILQDWDTFGRPADEALDVLSRRAELCGGRLAGAYQDGWLPEESYSCLTGNVQLALCLLHREVFEPDIRLVNTAAKLVDYVCSCQRLHAIRSDIRGAVAGSYPPWGSYMFLRYPNWAAKYHCDALMELMDRLTTIVENEPCVS